VVGLGQAGRRRFSCGQP